MISVEDCQELGLRTKCTALRNLYIGIYALNIAEIEGKTYVVMLDSESRGPMQIKAYLDPNARSLSYLQLSLVTTGEHAITVVGCAGCL